MLEINWLDASDPLSVVDDVVRLAVVPAWLHKGVEHNIAVEVDHRDPRQHLSFVGEHPLAVKSEHLSLPK